MSSSKENTGWRANLANRARQLLSPFFAASLGVVSLGAACGGDETDHSAIEALKQRRRMGVIPGQVVFQNGDVVDRPLGYKIGQLECPAADGTLLDLAEVVVYRKNGETVEARAEDIERIEFRVPELVTADQRNSATALIQCITAESTVRDIGDDGWCVPVGIPEPQSQRLAVGFRTTANVPLGSGDNC